MKQLVTFALILALAACTASSPSSRPEVAPDSSPEFPETIITRDVPGEIQFDWDEAMQNIYICGRKIHFPENAEDLLGQLGEGFDGFVEDLDPPLLNLNYEGRSLDLLVSLEETKRKPSLKNKITQIYTTVPGDLGIYQFRSGQPCDEEELFHFFGKPTKTTVYTEQLSWYEYSDDVQYLLQFNIFTSETGKKAIDSIDVFII